MYYCHLDPNNDEEQTMSEDSTIPFATGL